MNKLALHIPLLATVVVLAGSIAMAQGARPPAPAAQVARGKVLFNTIGCSLCHGTAGQGGIGPMSGPRIAVRDDLPVEAFTYLVRHPAAAMPPYSEKVLSDAQIADLRAYLAGSFRPGHVSDIPLLHAAH